MQVCEQTRIRIRLAIAAYGYEFENHSIISDAEYDALSLAVDVSVKTSRPDLDKFFSESFDPSTGTWVHKHPELAKVKALFVKHYFESP